MTDEEQRTTHCHQCRLSIPQGAKIAPTVSPIRIGDVGFLSRHGIGATYALISVLSFAVPSFIGLLHKTPFRYGKPDDLSGGLLSACWWSTMRCSGSVCSCVYRERLSRPRDEIRLRDDQKASLRLAATC